MVALKEVPLSLCGLLGCPSWGPLQRREEKRIFTIWEAFSLPHGKGSMQLIKTRLSFSAFSFAVRSSAPLQASTTSIRWQRNSMMQSWLGSSKAANEIRLPSKVLLSGIFILEMKNTHICVYSMLYMWTHGIFFCHNCLGFTRHDEM